MKFLNSLSCSLIIFLSKFLKFTTNRQRQNNKLRVSLKIYPTCRPKILQKKKKKKKLQLQRLSIRVSKDSKGETSPLFSVFKSFPRFYFSSRFFFQRDKVRIRLKNILDDVKAGQRSIRQNVSAVETEWLLVHLLWTGSLSSGAH